MRNQAEKDMTIIGQKDRIAFHLTLEEIIGVVNFAVDNAFEKFVDKFEFWDKYDDSMTRTEAMEALKVSRSHFKKLIDEEEIQPHNLNGVIRFKKQDLLKYYDSTNKRATIIARIREKKRRKTG